MKRTTRQLTGQRGEAYILLLVLLLLATMFSATLLASSSVGVTAEARRYAQQRAQLNALSGLVLAEAQLKHDLPPLFRQLASQANAAGSGIDQSLPYLAGVTFDPVDMHFAMPGSDATADDTADVRVEIGLPAPPEAVSLAGVPLAAGEVQRSEKYTFKVSLTSTGHSIHESRAVARRSSSAFVGVVIGGGMDSGLRSTLGSGNVIVVDNNTAPFYEERKDSDEWNLMPVAYADSGLTLGSTHQQLVTNYTTSNGQPPTGGWSGEPILLNYATPMKAGLANGDEIYYWYVKGLPPGSIGDSPGGAPAVAGSHGLVLASDDWRFSSSYRASDDTISIQRPDGTITRGQGSPLYGVIGIQAPSAYDGARGTPLPTLDGWFRFPGVGDRRYVVTENSWKPDMALPNLGGTQYTTVGYPENPIDRGSTPGARVVSPAPPPGTTVVVASERNAQLTTTNITVPGTPGSQDQMTGTPGFPSGGAGLVTVATVSAIRADIAMNWSSGGSAGTTTNSSHGVVLAAPISIDGGGIVPIDPPPPGGTPTTQIIAFLYWPGSTWWLPDRIDPNNGK